MSRKCLGITVVLCLLMVAVYVFAVGRPIMLAKDTSLPFDMPEDFKDILYYASLAPSGHNTQPWKVRYNRDAKSFTLFFDVSRGLPQVDSRNREALISLGAFLENLNQAAQAYGYEASIAVLPEFGINMEIAHATLEKVRETSADTEQRLESLRIRHTDKRSYEPRPIPETAIRDILGNHHLYLHFYRKGSAEFAWLSANAVEAMRVQAHHEGKRAELADWMRFSDREAQQMRDGLPAEQLNLKGPLKAFFYTFYNRESAAEESFALEAIKKTEGQVSSATGFFVVTGASDFTSTIQAGRHFERFWLDATEMGISIHPLSQILEEGPFANTVSEALHLDAPVQMIVRAGMNADYGQSNRIRRAISSFLWRDE